MRQFGLSLLILLVLTSCAVGPRYHEPKIELPQSYREFSSTERESIADLPWWESSG